VNGLVLCLCFALGLGGGGAAGDPPRDAWFAEDKYKHFAAAFAATTLSASAARTAGLERDASLRLGAATGAAFSLWKEIEDHRRPGGYFSVRDLVWDAAGVGAGVYVVGRGR
jgi:uncharacterized protein YfiM (DUF2279 family)